MLYRLKREKKAPVASQRERKRKREERGGGEVGVGKRWGLLFLNNKLDF
ncbi:hypothetical protein HanRHA438_Chr06g0260621 [Helianthus annuus]|nr:hypothetical protein HanIR_Chr06g0270561 [Helianthus annuus]KAJ0911197.1 hypothetical protein HanRHA438_Chr06g0260621 [Helianthus annuus]